MDTAASPVGAEIPYRRPGFLSYVGLGCLSGAIAGSTVDPIRAYRSAAAGSRLAAAGRAALVNAPRVGGKTGVYWALFYVVEGVMAHKRRRHDRWNSAAAGAVAEALPFLHLGGAATAANVLCGAAIGATLDHTMYTSVYTGKHPPWLWLQLLRSIDRKQNDLEVLDEVSAGES